MKKPITKYFTNCKRKKNYYNLQEIKKRLKEISPDKVIVEETYISPLYLDKGIYEVYHLALSIKLSNAPNREKAFPGIADKPSIQEIPKDILDRLYKTYFEVKQSDSKEYLKIITTYIEYIEKNEEIEKMVIEVFGNYSPNSLYIEIL